MVFSYPVPSQLSSVAGIDLPAAMAEENEGNSGSLTSHACSLSEGYSLTLGSSLKPSQCFLFPAGQG